jgi:hypothetical protein
MFLFQGEPESVVLTRIIMSCYGANAKGQGKCVEAKRWNPRPPGCKVQLGGDPVLIGNNRISSHNVFVETVTNRDGEEADVSQVFAFRD